jgi:methionyl-tRNA formyltransferase
LQREVQDDEQSTYAPLMKKEDGRIDWSRSAREVHNQVRGLDPWPGAYTFFGDKRLKIFRSRPLAIEIMEPPGTVIKGFADELRVATAEGVLCVEEIQGDSGKRLLVKDFLRGNRIPIGSVLG